MGLERLVYTPLMEDEQEKIKGWEKTTVDYMIKNERQVRSYMGSLAGKKYSNFIDNTDVDDIYSESLMYFYEVDDYDINIATEHSKGDYIITLEDYIYSSIRFCIKRYITKKYNREVSLVNTEVTLNDEMVDLINILADKQSEIDFENATVDLDRHCKECEHLRYNYGIDIYEMWYVGLLVIYNELEEEVYTDIMSILGINKTGLKDVSIKAYEDETIHEFAMGISKHGIEESIDILEKYVYSAEQIKKAIESLALAEVS